MAPKFEGASHAAVILAGGDGIRLSAFTRQAFGYHIPKQFCPLFEGETLLEQTKRRISLLIPPSQTITVLNHAHEQFYSPLLCGSSSGNLLIQPANRGTVAAILGALMQLVESGFAGAVTIFPSDHYVSDDSIFMDHVLVALRAAELDPHLAVILGIKPDYPETEYGWIEPARNVVVGTYPEFAPISQICRFWEKPTPGVANELYERGCLWNSFVLVANAKTLLLLMAKALPDLYRKFASSHLAFASDRGEAILCDLYQDLPTTDFSSQVLTRFSGEFAVLPVSGVRWSDLGDPKRLLAVISANGTAFPKEKLIDIP
jgi:mannose-1-phosphate guanylyltransferase